MFNGSCLRARMKLQIVQKIRFSLHESGWTKAWCPSLVSGPSAKAWELVASIFEVSSSTGLGIEGCQTCWKDE